MNDFTLTIGDRNLSSWSFRPWLLMKQAGIDFTEENIALDQPETRSILKQKSPSGFVPFLTHQQSAGDLTIWDSLAIAEYLNDLYPDKELWPASIKARAMARSITCEMHSGFSALRTLWPMMFLREGLQHSTGGGVAREIARIDDLWSQARSTYGSGGVFLFGKFSIADAFYAPVVSRFITYGPVNMSETSLTYMKAMQSLPAWTQWRDGATQETSSRD